MKNRLLIDIGSTYFKVCDNKELHQHFRDFNKDIFDDLKYKCNDILENIIKKIFIFVLQQMEA